MADVDWRKMRLLGHILRNDELKNIVVTGFVDGKRGRGRHK